MTASMSRRRATARAGAAATEHAISAELVRKRAEAAESIRAIREEADARRSFGGQFTTEDLAAAHAVETARQGWLLVLKVNRRTVTVDCFGALVIPVDKVIGAACQWPRTQAVAS